MRTLFFTFSGYAGIDVLLGLLPKAVQNWAVARAWCRTLEKLTGVLPDPARSPMVIRMPWGSFRLLDCSGKVERVPTEQLPV